MTVTVKFPNQLGGHALAVGAGTRVVDEKTGAELQHILAIDIQVRPNQIVRTVVEVPLDTAQPDITGTELRVVCRHPVTGEAVDVTDAMLGRVPARTIPSDVETRTHAAVRQWIDENKVTCVETIWQMDKMVIASQELAEKLCGIAGYAQEEDDE